jgi:penicillin-binding protein 2
MAKHVELKIIYARFLLPVAAGDQHRLVLLLLATLLVRFAYLQVVRHDYYQTLAETNRISIVPIVPIAA